MKKIRFLWLKKLLYAWWIPDYYWHLKRLLGKEFSIELITNCGYMIRELRIHINGEYRNICITDNFEVMGKRELKDIINNKFKDLYEKAEKKLK